MRALVCVFALLAIGCPSTVEEPGTSPPADCDNPLDSGDWATAVTERCVPGQVVERAHEIPKDAPPDMEGPPMEGVTVEEYGGGPNAVSDGDGRFLLELEDSDLVGVIGGAPGFVSRAFLLSWPAFELGQRGIEVDLPEAEHELELYEEVYGTPWSDDRSAVYIHFFNPDDTEGGSLGGATASLEAGAGPFVYVGDEELEPGNTIPEFTPDPQVLFADVSPGDRPLTIEEPDGLVCHAPAVLPVLANAMIDVWVVCVGE
jgi:hypothetical protein